MSERRQLFPEEAVNRHGRSEPIDGLLRVTAPHEWVFLVLLGCAMLGALAWGVFGAIERGVAADCVFVAAPAAESRLQAVAQVSADNARQVRQGMAVSITTPLTQGPLPAQVQSVARRPSSAGYSVRMRLTETSPSFIVAGDPCQARIVISREAPLRQLWR